MGLLPGPMGADSRGGDWVHVGLLHGPRREGQALVKHTLGTPRTPGVPRFLEWGTGEGRGMKGGLEGSRNKSP